MTTSPFITVSTKQPPRLNFSCPNRYQSKLSPKSATPFYPDIPTEAQFACGLEPLSGQTAMNTAFGGQEVR